MNIEDKLPKAEDVLNEFCLDETGETFDDLFTSDEIDAILSAIQVYTRRVLDVVAENATYQNTTGYGQNLLNTESILKFKDILK